jgi:hypothetical protein
MPPRKKSVAPAPPSTTGKRIGSSLDRYFGRWKKAQARAFNKAVSIFSRTDREFWK